MSEKRDKAIRRLSQKKFDKSARKAIFVYVDRLVAEPLHVRLAYAWRLIRGRNPHTNEKKEKAK